MGFRKFWRKILNTPKYVSVVKQCQTCGAKDTLTVELDRAPKVESMETVLCKYCKKWSHLRVISVVPFDYPTIKDDKIITQRKETERKLGFEDRDNLFNL